MNFLDRFRNAWNVFKNKDPTVIVDTGPGYGTRPDRMRFSRGNERSIITSVFNRIAMDVAAIPIQHVRLDEDGYYTETIHSGLNECLNVEANLDQTGRAFMQDATQSMFDEGCVALVPTSTTCVRALASASRSSWRRRPRTSIRNFPRPRRGTCAKRSRSRGLLPLPTRACGCCGSGTSSPTCGPSRGW